MRPSPWLALDSKLWRSAVACALLAVTTLLAPQQTRAVGTFDIVINPGPTLAANPQALSAFERAAQEWENMISNPIQINITADLGAFANNNIIGSTNAALFDQDFNTVRNAMAGRAVRPGNAVLAALPTSATVTATVPAGKTFLNSLLTISRANQKALGLRASDGVSDGTITFNNAFSFDYDRSNGVTAGQTDFQTVAAHEIGHMLGFFSNVDDFDNNGNLPNDDLSTLDLFRFSIDNNPSNLANFTTTPRELRPGQESFTDDVTAIELRMSTGVNTGDGRQASHWKDDQLLKLANPSAVRIGIMDPTLGAGDFQAVNGNDLRALELIGYDVVPEPGSVVGCLIGALGLLAMRSRRQQAVA